MAAVDVLSVTLPGSVQSLGFRLSGPWLLTAVSATTKKTPVLSYRPCCQQQKH